VCAEVGVYFDQENWWALELPSKPNADLTYKRGIERFYAALHRENLTADFVFESTDLAAYKVIFAPALYLVKPGVAEKLCAFVEGGGQLVLTYFSGIVDEHDRVHLGGYPAPFRKLLGLEVEEWTVPPDDRASALAVTPAGTAAGLASSYPSSFWAEVIRSEGAEVLATFTEGFLAGKPAVTRNTFGRGCAWYVGTDSDATFYTDLVRSVTETAGVHAALFAPAGVEVVERHAAHGVRYMFLLNHNETPATVTAPAMRGHELLAGVELTGSVELPAHGVAIVKRIA
jgi:beta-galactosidase